MSAMLAIAAPRIFDGQNWRDDHAVIVDNGQVRDLLPVNEAPEGIGIERLEKGFLAPGFVDLQVNGGGGVLLNNDPSVNGIRTICAAHARFGVTSVLPTLITDTNEVRRTTIEAGIEAAETGVPGFAGLHLEGPHLSVSRKGAHDPALIRAMTGEDVALLIDAANRLPVLITTVAPESVTPAQVRALAEAGVVVSVGHSDATVEEVVALADAGARLVTHLFNAMSQMTGREPGMVGAALNTPSLSPGLIADTYHVHPESMGLALRAKKGPGRIFLISDAMSTAGTDVTELALNGRRVRRIGGRLLLDDGTLAGADLELATAVRVLHQRVGVDLTEALRMASLYPAEAAGLQNTGALKPGQKADFVWLDDRITPLATWIAGRRVA